MPTAFAYLQSQSHPRVSGPREARPVQPARCMLHVACCMLHLTRRMLHARFGHATRPMQRMTLRWTPHSICNIRCTARCHAAPQTVHLRAPRRSGLFVCLFVCLFVAPGVCLSVCLFLCCARCFRVVRADPAGLVRLDLIEPRRHELPCESATAALLGRRSQSSRGAWQSAGSCRVGYAAARGTAGIRLAQSERCTLHTQSERGCTKELADW